ncbi:aquaporin-like protein [Infundibulicybe gibba]|nr:aquaporin-like protein [Infundibulicybe gibba]
MTAIGIEDLAGALLEFIGTAFFLLLGLGGIQAATAEDLAGERRASTVQQVLYVSTSMGFSLLVSAWLSFNPNISLALLLVGVIKPLRFVLYCLAQLLGAIAGSGLLVALTSNELSVDTTLQEGTSVTQGVFIEMFVTSALVLSVLMLAAEKHQATAFAPIGIGLTLFVGHLFAVYYTGASMNTARSFGPAVITKFTAPHHWVYWVGPFLGSLLGSAFYATIKHYRYWTLNPDQATSDTTKSPPDPVTIAKAIIRSPIISGQGDTPTSTLNEVAGIEQRLVDPKESPV